MSKRTLALLPENKDAHKLIAEAYIGLGAYGSAIEHLEKAREMEPENGVIRFRLGEAYRASSDFDAALQNYDDALARGFGAPELYSGRGTVLNALNRYEEAKEDFRTAVRESPDNTAFMMQLGMLQLHCGDKKGTQSTFMKMLEIDPYNYRAYYLLSRSRKHKSHDAITKRMAELYASGDTPKEGRMYLGYGLGKIYEELGRYDEAFECLETANKIKRAEFSGFSVNQLIDTADKIKERFSEQYIKRLGDTGYRDKTPVFVVGMPRSGTSLVEQILASHPSVYGAGELPLLFDLVKKDRHDADAYAKLGKAYIDGIRTYDESSEYIVDKQPANYLHIPFILLALPDAKIIHCVRDPMDTCFSNFKNYFDKGRPASNDLIEMGKDYLIYRDLMDYFRALFPGKIHDVVYEAMVENQEGESRKMLEFCGIPWSDDCLTFYRNERAVKTMSSVQVRTPVYNDSVKLWHHYRKQLEPLEKLLEEGKRPMAEKTQTLTIDGKTYDMSTLPEEAKAQIQNIRFAEAELQRLHAMQAVTQTALNSYKKALAGLLPQN